jgi:hypothetical protein
MHFQVKNTLKSNYYHTFKHSEHIIENSTIIIYNSS